MCYQVKVAPHMADPISVTDEYSLQTQTIPLTVTYQHSFQLYFSV